MVKFSDGSQCILAGDFNTQPDMPLYKMITSGTVCDDTINILLSSNHYIDSKMLIGEQVLNLTQRITTGLNNLHRYKRLKALNSKFQKYQVSFEALM